MVRLASSLALLSACALPLAQAGPFGMLYSATDSITRFGLKNVLRLNDTQIERVMTTAETPLEPHPYAFDLTDSNYETVLATGTSDNPFAPTLPKDDIWVITVFGSDPVSKPFLEGMNNVSLRYSHEAGGPLPAKMHFARLNYARETVLPTRLWVWKTPVIVVATNQMQTLRFLKPGHVRPNDEELAEILGKPEVWSTVAPWQGLLAPGGHLEPQLAWMAKWWAKIHNASAKMPSVVLLGLSGFIMSFVVSWFHKDDAKLQREFEARKKRPAADTPVEKAEVASPKAKSTATPSKKTPSRRK